MSTDKELAKAQTFESSPTFGFSDEPDNGKATKSRSWLSRYASRFRPARQLPLAWTSALLTVVFLILTAVYSSQPTVASRMRLLYTSSSNTIFVLSILTNLTAVFLSATIAATFERLQWILVARRDGLRLTNFLSLQAGTGSTGLLALTAGGGQPIRATARLWSAGRFVSIILGPVLSILIMSNVETRLTFDAAHQPDLSVGWGMSPFNASLANNVSLIADELLQAQLAMFLSDPSRAVDITPSTLRSIPCSRGPNSQSGQTCQRTFFIPGGVEFAAPTLYGDGNAPAQGDVFLARNQQGYVLDFQEAGNDRQFDEASHCQVYGFPFAAIHLCLRNTANNTLDARIMQCPSELSAQFQCRRNTSWHSNPGWSTTLTASFRRATVAYSRTNGTIISHVFSETPVIPAPVNAAAMLHGYQVAMGNFRGLQEVLAVLSDPNRGKLFPLYVFPAFMWGCLKGVSSLGSQNPAVLTRAADALHCLLAIMLYYCQPSLFARALSKSTGNRTAGDETVQKFASDMLAIAPPDTPVSLAALKYQVIVGQAQLIAYVVLCSVALLLCLGLLIIGSYAPIAGRVPETSAFPTWDLHVHCKLESADVEAPHPHSESLRDLNGNDLVRMAAKMKVRLKDTGNGDDERAGSEMSSPPTPAEPSDNEAASSTQTLV